MVVLIIGLFISIFSYNLFLTEAHAIPVFARKYKTSCQTCHVAFPRLNAFGEAFRRNGYQFPQNDEGYVKEEPLAIGYLARSDTSHDAYYIEPRSFGHL